MSKNFAINLHRVNQDSFLIKSYRNTFHCCENMIAEENGKLKSRYCKNRWCAICNRIRTAVLMDSYIPQLGKLEDPMFLTLTLPTCYGKHLSGRIIEMRKEWNRITDLAKRNKFKELGIKRPVGLRKSECTARPMGRYHFHYHIIVDGHQTADWILDEWLKRFPKANKKAQDIRLADEGSLKELFKYFTKVTYKGQISDYKSLDAIFRAMRGKRVFQPFGGLKKASEEITEALVKKLDKPNHIEGNLFQWNDEMTDWISEYGELLTNYKPSKRLAEIFKKQEEIN